MPRATSWADQNSNLQTLKKYIPLKAKGDDLDALFQSHFHLFQRLGVFSQSPPGAEFHFKALNAEAADGLVQRLRDGLPRDIPRDFLEGCLGLFRQTLESYADFKVG